VSEAAPTAVWSRRPWAPLIARYGQALPLALVVVVLVGEAIVLGWNSQHYWWLASYDADASQRYAYVVGQEHRLPTTAETTVWHNPPLFFAAAAVLEKLGGAVGLEPRENAVQIFSAACVLGIVLFTGLIARELSPRRPWVWALAVLVAASTPVLVRAGSLYHPEPLAAFLTTAGTYVVVRMLARPPVRLFLWAASAGVLLALANLTRTWALAALGASIFALALRARIDRGRRWVGATLVVAIVAGALTGPWFVVKWIKHGSPLAYSQPVPEQWLQRGRPPEFFFGLALGEVFVNPYQPAFRNHLAATVYSDWWGDYWRTYHMPVELRNEPALLPAEYASPLRTQSWVGLLITVPVLAGFVILARRVWTRRDTAAAAVWLSLSLLAVSFVGFLWRYPKQDGDNIKALYVLNAAPLVAILAAVALERLARGNAVLRAAVAVALLAYLVPTVSFLWL
jgi:4-amino-4-deoxy-L-arabinose transferase-like glycosyltransferase